MALAQPIAAGSYKITYRVVSADSHPISGSTAFTIAGDPPVTVALFYPTAVADRAQRLRDSVVPHQRDAVERAVALDPDNRTLLDLSMNNAMTGRQALALAQVSRSVRLSRNVPNVRWHVGAVLEMGVVAVVGTMGSSASGTVSRSRNSRSLFAASSAPGPAYRAE